MFTFPITMMSSDGSYTITNALYFDGSSDYLERTPSSASNRDTWSFSCWVKRSTFTQQQIFTAGASSANRFGIGFKAAGTDSLSIFDDISSGTSLDVVSVGAYRDPTAWMHVLFVHDSTQGTAADRAKLYVNGVQQSYGSASYQGSGVDGSVNNNVVHRIGRLSYSANHPFAGYLAEVILAEVALSPTDVGEYDDNGIWLPIKPSGLTFGTNGFHLDFKVAPGTGNGAGTDVSGNNNHFTDVSLTAAQQVTDSCTDDADNNIGNYATLNPIYMVSGFVSADLSNGNLTANSTNTGSGNARHAVATIPIPSSGKWAAKMTYNSGNWLAFGVGENGTYPGVPSGPFQDSTFDGFYQDPSDLDVYDSGSAASTGHTKLSAGQYSEILVDVDANTIKVYVQGSQVGSTITNISATNPVFVLFLEWSNVTLDFGQSGYTPTDTSYKTLNTANLPAPTVTKPSDHFTVKALVNGGSPNTSFDTGLDSIGLIIAKRTDGDAHWEWFDSVRGANSLIQSSNNDGVSTKSGNSFSGGTFNFDNTCNIGQANTSHIVYSWISGGAPSADNSGGQTPTNNSVMIDGAASTASISTPGSGTNIYPKRATINNTANFAVITHTNQSGDYSVCHGASFTPTFLIQKGLGSQGWLAWSDKLGGNNKYLSVSSTGGTQDPSADPFHDDAPTVQTFSNSGTDWYGGGSFDIVTYLFDRVSGFCDHGLYTGTGTDGVGNNAFVNVGFSPALLIIKSVSTGAWHVIDNVNTPYNGGMDSLNLNDNSDLDGRSSIVNRVSFSATGFSIGTNDGGYGAGNGYVYLTFAEHPFGGNGVAQARAR